MAIIAAMLNGEILVDKSFRVFLAARGITVAA
jgi:hypothetical protein